MDDNGGFVLFVIIIIVCIFVPYAILASKLENNLGNYNDNSPKLTRLDKKTTYQNIRSWYEEQVTLENDRSRDDFFFPDQEVFDLPYEAQLVIYPSRIEYQRENCHFTLRRKDFTKIMRRAKWAYRKEYRRNNKDKKQKNKEKYRQVDKYHEEIIKDTIIEKSPKKLPSNIGTK